MSEIKLDTQKGLTVPVKSTAEKNAIVSPDAGAVIFDSDLGKLCVYTGSAWQSVTSL